MGKIYGYCRISTKSQTLERQEQNIKAVYPVALIYKEAYTGTKLDRPVWSQLRKRLKKGDVIIFDEVSRMSRNAEEGFSLYQELFTEGIDLIFLKEAHINTQVYRESMQDSIAFTGNDIADIYIEATNKVLMLLAEKQIRLAFEQAQKEVDYLRQRTREGIEVARQNGKQIGQKDGAVLYIKNKEPIKRIIWEKSKSFNGHDKDNEVMAIINSTTYTDEHGQVKNYHVANNTYYKYKKEVSEESAV